jgi:peptide/nickel transport system substrate-binding protein
VYILLGAAGISILFGITNFVRSKTKLIPQSGGTYTEGAVGQPHYVNPLLANMSDVDADISRLVFSGLFRLDENLNLQNDLTDSYQVADNQRDYTIKLKPNLLWHDGQALHADDVVFTIHSIQNPEYGSSVAAAFAGVDVTKIDDLTVKFSLKQPYAPFLTSLTVGIIPQHVWENIDPKNAALAQQMIKPVGSGPYKFNQLTTKRQTGEITSYRLTRFDKYYGPKPYINDIVFSVFNTQDDAVTALQNGKIDGLGFVPLQRLDKLEQKSNLAVHRLLLPQYFALFFNQSKNAALNDAGVRNALDLAIDRKHVVNDALGGEGEVLSLPIPPGTFSYNEQLAPNVFDPVAAKQNLDSAGWKVGSDGVRVKNKQQLKVTITTTDRPEYVRTAELVKEEWEAIGVHTDIQTLSSSSIQQIAIRPRNYDVLLFGEILSAQPDPYPFWHSSQAKSPGLNFSMFSDKSVDTLLEKGRQTLDNQARAQLYNDFQAKVLELKPALILYRPFYIFVAKNSIHGADLQYVDRPAGRFNNVSNWYVKTKRVWK